MIRAVSCAVLFALTVAATGASANVHGQSSSVDILHSKRSPFFPSDDEKRFELLSKLLGTHRPEEFFSKHLGSQLLHVQRASMDIPSPVNDVDLAGLFESSDVTLRSWGSNDKVDKQQTTFEDFESIVAKGGSGVFKVVNDKDFAPLKLDLEDAFGCPLSLNIYHSGPEGVALKPHTDRYDVLVLQLSGSKNWEICIPEVQTSDGTGGALDDADKADLRELSMSRVQGCTVYDFNEEKKDLNCFNKTLAKGDLLYLPKGIIHSATTLDGHPYSTHATIGLVRDRLKFGDLLMALLREHADQLSSNSEVADESGVEKTFASLFLKLSEEVMMKDSSAGLAWRRMMPPWIVSYYEGCSQAKSGFECDDEKMRATTEFLYSSMSAMLDDLEHQATRYLYESSAHSNETISPWVVELKVEAEIANLKSVSALEAGLDAFIRQWRFSAPVTTKEDGNEDCGGLRGSKKKKPEEKPMSTKEVEDETAKLWKSMEKKLEEELYHSENSDTKYPAFAQIKKQEELGAITEEQLLAIHRERNLGIDCTSACNAVKDVCNGACSVVYTAATACYSTCNWAYSACLPFCKFAGCDDACFTSCDEGCWTSCDSGGICTGGCDDTCFSGCDGCWGLCSCDSGCVGSCDDNCFAHTSDCDGGCWLGCDDGCTLGCDDYIPSCKSGCDSAKNACYGPCDDIQYGAEECSDFCNTDLNVCNTICTFIDAALEAIESGVSDAISDVSDFIDDMTETISSVATQGTNYLNELLTEAETIANSVDLRRTRDRRLEPRRELNSDAAAFFEAFGLGLFTPFFSLGVLMASIPIFGLAGIGFEGSAGFMAMTPNGIQGASVGISLEFLVDDYDFTDGAIVLTGCVSPLSTGVAPPVSAGVTGQYSVTFGSNAMTYSDNNIPGGDSSWTVAVSTTLTKISLGGSVGFNMFDNGEFLLPFESAPNSATISAGGGSEDFEFTFSIGVCYSGAVLMDIADRRELEGEYTNATRARRMGANAKNAKNKNTHSSTNAPTSSPVSGPGNSDYGRARGESMKETLNNFGRLGKGTAKLDRGKNEPESEEDKRGGKGTFDRTVNPNGNGKKPTMADLDRDYFKELVKQYDTHFRGTVGEGLPLQAYIKRLDQEQQDKFWTELGIGADTIAEVEEFSR